MHPSFCDVTDYLCSDSLLWPSGCHGGGYVKLLIDGEIKVEVIHLLAKRHLLLDQLDFSSGHGAAYAAGFPRAGVFEFFKVVIVKIDFVCFAHVPSLYLYMSVVNDPFRPHSPGMSRRRAGYIPVSVEQNAPTNFQLMC